MSSYKPKFSTLRGFIGFKKGGVLLPSSGNLPRSERDLWTAFRPGLGYIRNNWPDSYSASSSSIPAPPVSSDTEPSEFSSESVEDNSNLMDPIATGTAIATRQAYSNKAQKLSDEGTVASKVASENVSRKGDSISSGILAGSTIGSVFGPIGTAVGAVAGGLIGSSTATQRQIATTAGDEDPTNPNLAY